MNFLPVRICAKKLKLRLISLAWYSQVNSLKSSLYGLLQDAGYFVSEENVLEYIVNKHGVSPAKLFKILKSKGVVKARKPGFKKSNP
jgi:hypothetical protein